MGNICNKDHHEPTIEQIKNAELYCTQHEEPLAEEIFAPEYTAYIKSKIEPWLEKKIVAGKFKKGEANIKIFGKKATFKGRIDDKGMAIGKGVATWVSDSNYTSTGTFYKNVPHGQIIFKTPSSTKITEFRNGKLHGKQTRYNPNCIENLLYVNDQETHLKRIEIPDQVFFFKDGNSKNAHDENWAQYVVSE